MTPTYTYEVGWHKGGEYSWKDHDGKVKSRQFEDGHVFHFENACQILDFLERNSLLHTVVSLPDGRSSGGDIYAACHEYRSSQTVIDETPSLPNRNPDPVPAEPGDAAGIGQPTTNPPLDTSTPDWVNASPSHPDVISAPPPMVGVFDGRTVEERAHDREAPLNEGEVAYEVQAAGNPSDSAERVRRNEPTPGLPHYDFGRNDEPQPQVLGDPVDVFRGALVIEDVDVCIPGHLRPLELVRRYRSGVPWFGPWGFNWDHNYNAYLRPLNDGWVAVWTGLLNEDVYRPDPALGWSPPLGVTARLVHLLPDQYGGERWVVSESDGTGYRFEQPAHWPRPDRFPLVEMRDRFDNVQSLEYDADGRVERVIDDLGHFLAFGYGNCGLLEELTDSAGRRWRYLHDHDREHLIAVVQPATEEAPTGAVTRYEYDQFETHGYLRHNIVRVTAPDGCVKLENEYGKDPASGDFARVVQQCYGTHNVSYRATVLATISRVPDALNLPALQVETSTDRDYRVQTFNFRGGLLEDRYRLERDKSYRLVVEAFRYDARGNLRLHRRPNGMTTHYLFDVASPDSRAWRNLLEIRLEAPPSRPAAGRLIARMRYEPAFQLMTRHQDESGAETRFRYGHEVAVGGIPGMVRVEHPPATLPDGTIQTAVSRFTVNAHGQLTHEVSAEGREVAYRYGASGTEKGYLVARVRDPSGVAATDTFSYDAYGNVSGITDGEGGVTAFRFDARNRLVGTSKPTGAELVLSYHLDGELAQMRRPRGQAIGLPANETEIVTKYDYDVLGRLTRQVDAANADAPRERRYEYDAYGRVVAFTDGIGRRHETEFDERGGVLAETTIGQDGSQRTTRFIRDLNGCVRTSILPGGARVRWGLDAWDRLNLQEEPPYADGRVIVELRYGDNDVIERRRVIGPDGLGNPAALLAETVFSFDERGRPVGEDYGIGVETTWFDADGLNVRQDNPSGAQDSYGYDDLGRLVTDTDALGNVSSYRYDRVDRLLEVTVTEPTPAGSLIRRELRHYDQGGDQLDFVDALGRRTTYEVDTAGQVVAETDPTGIRTEIRYNAFAELVLGRAITGGVAHEHRIERDSAGRAFALVEGAGSMWRTDLSAFDEPLRQVTPDGREQRIFYATDGAVRRTELPGGSAIDYGRRADGALETVRFSAAGGSLATDEISFVRDGLGRLVSAVQGPHLMEWRYDGLGRVIEERSDGVALRRELLDATRADRIHYSDGRIDRREHDVLGRLQRVLLDTPGTATTSSTIAAGSVLLEYDYEGIARTVRRTLLNGHQLVATYNAAQRMVQLDHRDAGATAIVTSSLLSESSGRRLLVTLEGAAPWSDHAYEFDGLRRLATAISGVQHGPLPDPADHAAVDAFFAAWPALPAGDVLDAFTLGPEDTRDSWTREVASGAVVRTYAHDTAHRMTAITTNGATTPVTHDLDGRRTADELWGYGFDVLGRLREITDLSTGTLALTLAWDPLGRLHKLRRPNGEQIVLRYLGNCIVERLHSNGSLTQETRGALPYEVPMRTDPFSVLFRLQDHRGATLALVDGSGNAVERYLHEDFGAVTGWDGAGLGQVALTGLASPVLFAGLEYLADVGLYVGGERTYDPSTGSFLTPDPLGAPDSVNSYLYAMHNPVEFTDARGLFAESAWDAISLGVGVASLGYNLTRDKVDWWAVGLDVAGILGDTAALILPGVPGGAGALIKVSRSGRTGAEIVRQSTRAGRIVRYAQAATAVASGVKGGVESRNAVREGRYGAAAFGFGLAALGIRNSLGRFAAAGRHTPMSIYSVQGNVVDITRSSRIWGVTEGRVFGMNRLGAGFLATGKVPAAWPPAGQRVIFEFTGEAAQVFRPQSTWGLFTWWKTMSGQYVSGVGDLHLDQFTPTTPFNVATLSYHSVVTQATHLANDFASPTQSLLRAYGRASFPILLDTGLNAVMAGVPGLLGWVEGQSPVGEQLHQKLSVVPPTDAATKK